MTTSTVLIEPICIFCGQVTNEVQRQSFYHSSSHEYSIGGKKYIQTSSQSAQYPFPAHAACVKKEIGPLRIWFFAPVGLVLLIAVVVNVIRLILGNSLSSSPWICLFMASIVAGLGLWSRIRQSTMHKLEKKIEAYCDTHVQAPDGIEQEVVIEAGGNINDAIKRVKAGGCIRIKPNSNRCSLHAIVNKSVEIVGDGPAQDIKINGFSVQTYDATIRNVTVVGSVPVKVLAGNVLIEDCALTQSNFDIAGPLSKVTLRRCSIKGGSQSGVWVANYAQAILENCQINQVPYQGAGVENGILTVKDCTIKNAAKFGISVQPRGHATVSHCDVSGSGLSGSIVVQDASLSLQDCQMHDNAQCGVLIDGGSGQIENSTFYGNQLAGIEARKSGTMLTVRGGKLHDGKQRGIYVSESMTGTIEDCEITGSVQANVQIETGAHLSLTNCQIVEGQAAGINVNQATLTLEGCTVSGNALNGILATNASTITVRRSTLGGNQQEAIRVQQNSVATLEENDLAGSLNGTWLAEEGCTVTQSGNKEPPKTGENKAG